MSSQVWALVGVVVGAILGGCAQVLGDMLRYRRERATRLLELRREDYRALLKISNELHLMFVKILRGALAYDEAVVARVEAMVFDLGGGLLMVATQSSADVFRLGSDLAGASAEFLETPSQATLEAWKAADNRLRDRVREELVHYAPEERKTKGKGGDDNGG